MDIRIRRRSVLLSAPSAGLFALGLSSAFSTRAATAAQPVAAKPTGAPWPGFPQTDPAVVAQVVLVAHSSEEKVRALIDAHPSLVNAWWDWGFGDWESPLGAASHVGQSGIAELLISRGARADIFAATMLGWLPTVRAMIEATPGIERTLGPHGITLLNHARAGGERAASVLEYLKALPGADDGPKVTRLEPEALAKYTGQYSLPPAGDHRFTIRAEKSTMEFVLGDLPPRRLHCIDPDQFFPAGVPSVRFKFETAGPAPSPMAAVTITDHDLSLRCSRTT